MSKILVLAEKPSVGRDLARVLKCNKKGNGYLEGDKYIVTWALGHLVTLADPEAYDEKYKAWKLEDLPMLPKHLKLVVIKQSGKQYSAVREQMNRKDVSEIVIATDAGREGELVARWILEKAGIRKPLKRLWISSVTDKANVGGMKMSGLMAMMTKHMVNMYYLFGIGGLYLIWRYLQHEFFHMEDNRTIVRGHVSSHGNRLWLVPLRLFIGCMWLLEGLKKFYGEETWKAATESFSTLSNLAKGIGADSWLKSGNVKMPFEWLKQAGTSGATAAADAASGATGAAGGAASSWPTPIISEMPGFFKAIMEFMIPNPDIAVWFQRMVVLIEIGIGLALLAGLFTWIASAVSAFMVCNFILSAMAGWEILWYFFGSIALMGGAGRTLGLDYYVMPWLAKTLGKWWFGKETAIYGHDNSVSL